MGDQRKKYTRRDALRWLALTGTGAAMAACGGETPAPSRHAAPEPSATPASTAAAPTSTSTSVVQPVQAAPEPTHTAAPAPTAGNAYLSVARGEDPAAMVEAALRALGGMEHFVKPGYDVIIKPNICTDNHSYEYAATTNPVVVATLVRLALGAGAKRVRVMDFPFGGTAASAYRRSGIQEAVEQAGGAMEVMNPNKFRKTKVDNAVSLNEVSVFQDVLTCDLLINVPIAKHHSLARLTLGGKNLLGVIQNRSSMHARMGERVPDLVSLVKPGLTVVDAVRILMANGPTGGNLNDVKQANTIIASHDIVAADSYAAGLFDLTGADIAYVKGAAERGLGTMDLTGLKIEEVSV